MFGKSVKVAVAAVVAAGALAGCGATSKTGTAALVGDDRITVGELSDTVREWREQFRSDPIAGELRAGPANPAPQLAADSESDLRAALTLLINIRVADEVADREKIEVTGGRVDAALAFLGRNVPAQSVTLASGLPRERTRDLARLVATQNAVIERFGGDPSDRTKPATQSAGEQWNTLFRRTARSMKIEVNPRYGVYDSDRFRVQPAEHGLSRPDPGI
ncbi:MAG TPA: hypothetical protein VIL71_20900 [Spirillospora sp.]